MNNDWPASPRNYVSCGRVPDDNVSPDGICGCGCGGAYMVEERYETNFIEFMWKLIWRFLPDKCQGTNCPGKGVRGNENIVDGKTLCDDCSSMATNLKPTRPSFL